MPPHFPHQLYRYYYMISTVSHYFHCSLPSVWPYCSYCSQDGDGISSVSRCSISGQQPADSLELGTSLTSSRLNLSLFKDMRYLLLELHRKTE